MTLLIWGPLELFRQSLTLCPTQSYSVCYNNLPIEMEAK